MSEADPYTYPGSTVLRNRLGVTATAQLDRMERRLVTQRAAEGIPSGRFGLTHLRAIHRHLFQDVYDWAGELRTVEIAKDGHQFQFRRFIATGMQDVHQRLVRAAFLRGLSRTEFAAAAGRIIGDVNYVHPFREGNGRTQLFYLEQLAERAGHPIDLARLEPRGWLAASRASHAGDYEPMAAEIARALTGHP
ncbi:MAG TPA: Fic family protein [Rhodopila sp.]|nr:Fic family protein [Rhodopila sp.]